MKLANNKNMKNKKKIKNLTLIIPIIILLVISLLDMYGARSISSMYDSYYKRQLIWIASGIFLFIIISKMDKRVLEKYVDISYFLGIIALILVLFIGKNVNGASSWFKIGSVSIQPSEIFKPIFIVFLSKKACTLDNSFKSFIKIIIYTLIPCALIFLEPDTGLVLIYVLIMLGILLSINAWKKYTACVLLVSTVVVISFSSLYFLNRDAFTGIFGTSFFYRMDRLMSFKNNTSYQLNNALIGIGSQSLINIRLNHPKIYIPEITTDFVFDLTILNFGYASGIILIMLYTYVLYEIYKKSLSKKGMSKCILSSIFYMMAFQIYEHIFMNIGLLPITGITLPFLSYGGSSMVSYFMIYALIIKNVNDK